MYFVAHTYFPFFPEAMEDILLKLGHVRCGMSPSIIIYIIIIETMVPFKQGAGVNKVSVRNVSEPNGHWTRGHWDVAKHNIVGVVFLL